uniref:Uncharacterized protein n=1 Tax=Rhipicephalus zambeziensis TaxID=60191 RepID=A0A224YEB2_9ACAR
MQEFFQHTFTLQSNRGCLSVFEQKFARTIFQSYSRCSVARMLSAGPKQNSSRTTRASAAFFTVRGGLSGYNICTKSTSFNTEPLYHFSSAEPIFQGTQNFYFGGEVLGLVLGPLRRRCHRRRVRSHENSAQKHQQRSS